jgi:hypothetical protein
MPAPIALFVYRRPDHLVRTVDALRANAEADQSELFIFSDAAKNEATAADVTEVRRLLPTVTGFKTIDVVRRDRNFGLASNITAGVSAVLECHDSVIVLEDDLVVSPFFLRFMNAALSQYRDEPRVGSISGYCYPLDRPVGETFFIRGADCWGWATWRDRWRVYNPDGRELLAQLRSRVLTDAFDFGGAMGFTRMLEEQIAGKNDSWAVRWHASCFLRDLLILYPGRSLAVNIGHDGTGTHSTGPSRAFDVVLSADPVEVGGIAVEESGPGRDAIRHFFRATQPAQTLLRRVGVAMLDRLGLGDAARGLRARLGGRLGTTVTRAKTDNRSR